MTSEVLILNKHAAVLAADSAVTTTPATDGEHPRYSKTANKLFDLCADGNVAVMIFGGAQIDLVPWELAIKLFRRSAGAVALQSFSEHIDQLLAFLKANATLFPQQLRTGLSEFRLELAGKHILGLAEGRDSQIFDVGADLEARKASWAGVAAVLSNEFDQRTLVPSLTDVAYQLALKGAPAQAHAIAQKLSKEPELAAIDPGQLSNLATKALYKAPTDFLPSTGVVVAGYGLGDIFPGYRTIEVYGHVGDELIWREVESFQVTHTNTSVIKALAQTSMIDVFTDGFGFSLYRILARANKEGLQGFVDELTKNGAVIPPEAVAATIDVVHRSFMKNWTAENWQKNYEPLRQVLSHLAVEEIAHLAETLLTLESLKERVTSSSESVGGPIDVAAVTKSEGLVWLRRKHYFEPSLNPRYFARLRAAVQP
jgi:hypothetical protein